MPTIELNEDHVYKVDGIEHPSVTQILASAGLIKTDFVTEYGMDRGSKVHRACELDDKDMLDEVSLDPVLRPYLASWRAFRKESRFHPFRIEERLYCKSWGFCGTPDRFGLFQDLDTVMEIKCGSPEPWHALQLAAYQLLLRENAIPCRKRVAVYLSKTGYKIQQFKSTKDEGLFLACLAVYNFKKNGEKP